MTSNSAEALRVFKRQVVVDFGYDIITFKCKNSLAKVFKYFLVVRITFNKLESK